MLDALAASKMSKQGLKFFCTQALNSFERIGQTTSTSSFSMEGVHEPMSLITGVDQDPPLPVEHQRFVVPSVDGFLSFGQGCKRKPAGPPVFFESLLNG